MVDVKLKHNYKHTLKITTIQKQFFISRYKKRPGMIKRKAVVFFLLIYHFIPIPCSGISVVY